MCKLDGDLQMCDEINPHNDLSSCRLSEAELNTGLMIAEDHLGRKDTSDIQAHLSNHIEPHRELDICWQYPRSLKVPLGKDETEE